MRCGRRYALTFLALLLASASLWAFPGRGGAEPVIAPLPSVTMEAPIEEAASPKMPSGTASSETSDELRSSLKAAAEIADKPVIIGGGKSELSIVLDSLEEKLETAEASREAKDAEIAELKEALADAEAETGSKAYIMADGVIGFDADAFSVDSIISSGFIDRCIVEDYVFIRINNYRAVDMEAAGSIFIAWISIFERSLRTDCGISDHVCIAAMIIPQCHEE